jgi:hypothetical protein
MEYIVNEPELAILGLLVEKPRHGYEIEQVVEARGMREWTELGFSSIYAVLKRLEANGWIEGRLENGEGRGPARKVYAVTQTGFAAWQAGTIQALSDPGGRPTPFLLGLAGLPAIQPAQACDAIWVYRDTLIERRDRIRARRAGQEPLPPIVALIFDYSLAMVQAEIDWLASTINLLSDIQKEHQNGNPGPQKDP